MPLASRSLERGSHGKAIYPIDKTNGRESYGSGFGGRGTRMTSVKIQGASLCDDPLATDQVYLFSTTIDSLVISILVV